VRKLMMVWSGLVVWLIALACASVATASDSWLISDSRGSVAGVVGGDGVEFSVFNSMMLLGDVVRSSADRWSIHYNSGESRTSAILRVTTTQYRLGSGLGRSVRTASRWKIEKRSSGRWKSVGWAPRGCNGAVALGAGRLLLWSGPVPIPLRTWRFRDEAGHVLGAIAEMSSGDDGAHAEIRPEPYRGAPVGWVDSRSGSASVKSYRDGVFFGTLELAQVSASEWQITDGSGSALLEPERWVARKAVDGDLRAVGSAPKGCPGDYVLGAARLLAW